MSLIDLHTSNGSLVSIFLAPHLHDRQSLLVNSPQPVNLAQNQQRLGTCSSQLFLGRILHHYYSFAGFCVFSFSFFLVWCSGQIASYQVTTGIDIRHNLFFTYNGIHSESQFLFTSPNMQITYTNKATESNRSSPSDESPIGKCLTMAEAAAARGEERQPCQPRCR